MIVLDTHIWLWWVAEDTASLPMRLTQQLAAADSLGVSAISLFEVAWLAQHGRITLDPPPPQWFHMALQGSGIVLLPLTPGIATRAVALPPHHRDPHDRLIIATALEQGSQLMSLDGKFAEYTEIAAQLLQ